MPRRCKDASEQDVVYGSTVYQWCQRAGVRTWWKRRIRRRERREGRAETRRDTW